MYKLSIIVLGVISIIGIIVPSVHATSGTITLNQDKFNYYSYNNNYFSVNGEITDYLHKPSLEIIHNDKIVQTTVLSPSKNSLFTIVKIDERWNPGEYIINLKYQNTILDSKLFNIVGEKYIEPEIKIYENMSLSDSFMELDSNEFIIENSSNESIFISGYIHHSTFGNRVQVFVQHPDGTIENMGNALRGNDGYFSYAIHGIDKHWNSGIYEISVKYLDTPLLVKSFTIQNNFQTPVVEKQKLIGSLTLTSEISDGFTILEISGNIETDKSEITLQITKDEIILFEEILSVDNKLFKTNTVLYDYTLNSPWAFGEYQISGLIDGDSFYSDTFTLDGQSFSNILPGSMKLFLNLENTVQKMVSNEQIIISSGDTNQITLSGIMPNYSSGDTITVHLVNPSGTDAVSSILASSSGEYYMPIIIDDSWISGTYTAYVAYGEFVDSSSIFEVINNSIKIDDEIINEAISEITLQDVDNYSITLSDFKSIETLNFDADMNSYSGKTPIKILLNDELVREGHTYSSIYGQIDYYLNLDSTWASGNYTVLYVENNISIPFGTFNFFNNYLIKDESPIILVEAPVEKYLTLEKSVFKDSSHAVRYLTFSGKLVDDSTKKVSVFLDGKLQTMVKLDSQGNYSGTIYTGNYIDSGFHTISISSGDVLEHAEFLIATNRPISLDGDLSILRNSVVESGGEISIFLSKVVPNFVLSEIGPVIITVEGDDYYKQFYVMPKGFGSYSQNFMIGDSIGSYDVTVKYDDKIIESYSIDVILPKKSWIQSHATSWLNGETSDYAYFKKIILLLEDDYDVTPNVVAPDWFAESTQQWIEGSTSDDSFIDAILFLVENRLL